MTTLTPGSSGGESLSSIRGYLLHLAEQHLGGDLHAKGGASDVVQDALLAAHERGGQYSGTSDEQLKGWLRTILLNAARKFRRRWRAQVRSATREVSLGAAPAGRLDPSHRQTPSHIARTQERRRQLSDAVARLPHEQRQIVAWRVEEELSFPQIGARLGKSPDATRMLYNRALDLLQSLLPKNAADGWASP